MPAQRPLAGGAVRCSRLEGADVVGAIDRRQPGRQRQQQQEPHAEDRGRAPDDRAADGRPPPGGPGRQRPRCRPQPGQGGQRRGEREAHRERHQHRHGQRRPCGAEQRQLGERHARRADRHGRSRGQQDGPDLGRGDPRRHEGRVARAQPLVVPGDEEDAVVGPRPQDQGGEEGGGVRRDRQPVAAEEGDRSPCRQEGHGDAAERDEHGDDPAVDQCQQAHDDQDAEHRDEGDLRIELLVDVHEGGRVARHRRLDAGRVRAGMLAQEGDVLGRLRAAERVADRDRQVGGLAVGADERLLETGLGDRVLHVRHVFGAGAQPVRQLPEPGDVGWLQRAVPLDDDEGDGRRLTAAERLVHHLEAAGRRCVRRHEGRGVAGHDGLQLRDGEVQDARHGQPGEHRQPGPAGAQAPQPAERTLASVARRHAHPRQ